MLGKFIVKYHFPDRKQQGVRAEKKASTAPKQRSRGYQPGNGILREASLIARSLFYKFIKWMCQAQRQLNAE
jgi:hypothetical protein